MSIYQLGAANDRAGPHADMFAQNNFADYGRSVSDISGTCNARHIVDNDWIKIGDGSNIQDNAVLHTDPGFPLNVGTNVTIGHQAMLHGCTIGNGTLIGIQAVVMNGAVIGKDCLIGACALVPEGKVFPDRRLIVGAPAEVVRELTDEDVEKMHRAAPGYVQRQEMYKEKLKRMT